MGVESQNKLPDLRIPQLDALSEEQIKLQTDILQQQLKTDVLKNEVDKYKKDFSYGLVMCVVLNNFNGKYTTNDLIKDKELFRKTIEAYVTLKPTESARLQKQLAPRTITMNDFELFFDKVADYFQGYLTTSIDGKSPLIETYTSISELYKTDKKLFDSKTFASMIDDVANIYLLKNISKSGYKNVLVAHDVEMADQKLIKSILDVCDQEKNVIFSKLNEYAQYKTDKETFLKKEKFWRRSKKEDEMKLFGRKGFSTYATIATNYDLLRKIYGTMDITYVDSPNFHEDNQEIQQVLEDIKPILAKQKK